MDPLKQESVAQQVIAPMTMCAPMIPQKEEPTKHLKPKFALRILVAPVEQHVPMSLVILEVNDIVPTSVGPQQEESIRHLKPKFALRLPMIGAGTLVIPVEQCTSPLIVTTTPTE